MVLLNEARMVITLMKGMRINSTRKKASADIEQKELVVDEGQGTADDFERLLSLDNEFPDHFDESTRPSSNRIQESGDRQHDLIANIVDRGRDIANLFDNAAS